MNKGFFDLLLRIETRQGPLFNFILFVNELYISLYAIFAGPKMLRGEFETAFSAGDATFTTRRLRGNDLVRLSDFFKNSIDMSSPDFVMPHKTDAKALEKILNMVSHIPLGIYSGPQMIGYALIRLLFPNKGSYAIFIADKWQGRGIGTAALNEELKIIRALGFVPTSAVNKRNAKSLRMLEKLGMNLAEGLGDYYEVRDRL